MNFLIIIAILSSACLTSARPSWLAGPVGPGEAGTLLKGPSSATTLVGPDGSVISASAIGGAVVASPKSGGIVTGSVAPGIVAAGPILATPGLAAPLWGVPALSTPTRAILTDGPSGTVISSGLGAPLIAGPTKLIVTGLW